MSILDNIPKKDDLKSQAQTAITATKTNTVTQATDLTTANPPPVKATATDSTTAATPSTDATTASSTTAAADSADSDAAATDSTTAATPSTDATTASSTTATADTTTTDAASSDTATATPTDADATTTTTAAPTPTIAGTIASVTSLPEVLKTEAVTAATSQLESLKTQATTSITAAAAPEADKIKAAVSSVATQGQALETQALSSVNAGISSLTPSVADTSATATTSKVGTAATPAPNQNKIYYQSKVGTPVYSDLNITGDTYTLNGQTYTFTAIKIPEAVFEVSEQENNIVITKINGLGTNIVEFIGTDNWEVDVSIKLTNTNLLYPLADVKNLLLMLNCNKVLIVNSWYLNMLGISSCVIMRKKFLQKSGELNNQVIQFRLMSVVPLVQTQAVATQPVTPAVESHENVRFL